MASMLSVLKSVLPLNLVHVEKWDVERRTVERYGEEHELTAIYVHARPFRRCQCQCPVCGEKCARNGHRKDVESTWRAPDLNGVPVYIKYRPQRIRCPEHGDLNEWMPWTDGASRFTEDFNNEVAWLACRMSKSAIATFLRIDWRTVGSCLKAAHDRLEPDVEDRVHCGLRRICVDETSYSRGHRYVTVVYDMDRNRVAWVCDRHGKKVFERFCRLLTEEERAAVRVVAGDGARWIDECVEEYFGNATRCVDFFHVVGWANDALDDVRVATAARVRREHDRLLREFRDEEAEEARLREGEATALAEARAELAAMPVRGRPSKRKLELRAYIAELEATLAGHGGGTGARRGPGRPGRDALSPEHQAALDELERRRKAIKGARHALGHAPENRTANQDQMVALIEAEQPDLWRAFQLKERLRLVLHMRDADEAAAQLDEWMADASSCGMGPMERLAGKIGRHRENIVNAVRLQANSSKSESCNTTIKALIKVARGFRNLDNMMALIYLRCSDIGVPLHNQIQPSAEYQRVSLAMATARRRNKEERMQARTA